MRNTAMRKSSQAGYKSLPGFDGSLPVTEHDLKCAPADRPNVFKHSIIKTVAFQSLIAGIEFLFRSNWLTFTTEC